MWGAVCVSSASTVLRGVSDNREMVEILWHRRETRRQTEKTNIDLYLREKLIYSPNNVRFGQWRRRSKIAPEGRDITV